MTADVIVAGLGAMGAAAAWQLTNRRVRVLGFDRFRPPHDRGSSHGDSRIIRETAFEGPQYVPLVRAAYPLWAELEAEAGEPLLTPTGALYVGAPDSAIVTRSRASADAHGVAHEDLTASEVRRRFPAFAPGPGMVGLLERGAGMLRAERCVDALLSAARRAGAELRHDEPVLEWTARSGGVTVRTSRGSYEAGGLILATGAWMPEVFADLGVSLEVERQVQHWFAPARDSAELEPSRCPVYIWEDADGVIFYGFPLLDGAVKCAVHHRGETTTADAVRRDVTAGEVATARGYAERFVPPAAGIHLRSAVCLYTNSSDGHFIVDHHPAHAGVVLITACSGIGFKFAPRVGEAAALLLLEGAAPADAQPFGLARFG